MAQRLVVRLSVIAAILAAVSAYFFLTGWYLMYDVYIIPAILFQGSGILGTCVSAMCLDMIWLEPAESHTIKTLLIQYFGHRVSLWMGILQFWHMNRFFKDCKKAQENVLKQIINENVDTSYSRDHQLGSVKTREQFVAKHPLTTYSHFQEYAERVAKRERNVMTKADVIYLGLSSGTTGKNKMYPITKFGWGKIIQAFLYMRFRMNDMYKDIGLKRNFCFRIFHPQRRSEGGILMGGVGQITPVLPTDCNITPEEFIKIHQEAPLFYVQAIFAIAERNIGRIDGFSSDLLYAFFNFMVLNKEKICESLETGVIQVFPGLDDNIRWEMTAHLKADPARAAQARAELSGSKEGLALRLWPGLTFCGCATTGGFANCACLLGSSYLKNVRMAYIMHGGTEGIVGLALDVYDPEEYTMVPNVQFMEFIPVDQMEEKKPQTLFMEQLEVGKQYEVVATNAFGLYRNRFGDIIEITGFRASTPKYRFSYRSGQILNIAYDRTPEKAIYTAITDAARDWKGVTIADYTSSESFHLEALSGEVVSPGCYFIFLEVTTDDPDMRLKQTHAERLEACLCKAHESYKEHRHQGSVGPLRLIQVRAGCFAAVRAAMFSHRLNAQFKMPRVQRNANILKVLWDHRVL